MPEPRRALTADERLAALRRDRARLRRERMVREVGARADLFALLERVEAAGGSGV